MFENKKSDLHCHLNGSFSLEFLKKTAAKNKCLPLYEEFARLRQEYLDQTKEQPESGYPKEQLDKVWKLFELIHKIVQDLDDIEAGTYDVIKNSAARYLEIRTTPKAIAGNSIDDYITRFQTALFINNRNNQQQKESLGLLSLDRTLHTPADAEHFIKRIKNCPKTLVGLDIGGDGDLPGR